MKRLIIILAMAATVNATEPLYIDQFWTCFREFGWQVFPGNDLRRQGLIEGHEYRIWAWPQYTQKNDGVYRLVDIVDEAPWLGVTEPPPPFIWCGYTVHLQDTTIFQDGVESGTFGAWTAVVGEDGQQLPGNGEVQRTGS